MLPFSFRKENRDFIRMGRGIEARYERCRLWWHSHLAATRRFVRNVSAPASTVAVLGAGRLLDIDIDALFEVANEVHLFDLDRGSVPFWDRYRRRFGTRLVYRVEDVTSSIDQWSRFLKAWRDIANVPELLDSLEVREPAWVTEKFGGVVSLNLLGQIPLYWRDRVLRQFPDLGEDAMNSLDQSMGRLQQKHLAAVDQGASVWSAVITDREYLWYTSDRPDWIVEPALFGTTSELLSNFYPLDDTGITRETWWWHVVPQFVESEQLGSIHVVEARARRRH